MMRKLAIAAACTAIMAFAATAESSEAPTPPSEQWSFSGIFGTFDRASTRRGLQVYRQVCASCHALSLVAYRNLEAIGFTPEEVQAIAAEYEVEAGPNDEGDMFLRPAKPADRFVSPFANDNAARAANNGALPPDLSLITKARKSGPDYLYGLLTGYKEDPPEGVELTEGMYFNEYFPGHQIAMAPPLYDGSVDYADGTEPTLDQHSRDVVTFLTWTAQPELEQRKRMGVKVILFLIVLTALLYALKRKIWGDVH